MFRPPSLLASRVVPTAASSPAGQLRLLHPSRACIVAFARIGYAIRPTTGNWRSEDFHLARLTALSTAPLTLRVQSTLPNLKVRTDLVLRADAKTGWAIRKDSPKLAAEIDDFFGNWR
jgi:hypothetical protein